MHYLLWVPLSVCTATCSVVLALFTALTVYVWYVHRLYDHIPYPAGMRFYTGHYFLLKSKQPKFFFDIVYDWYIECGPIFVMWRWFAPTIFVIHPNDVKEIAITQTKKPSNWQLKNVWGIGHRFLGRSIFTIQKYEDWLPRSKVYKKAFSMGFLRSLIPQFNELTQKELIQSLLSKADGRTVVNMKAHFTNIALLSISRIAFGCSFHHDPYVKSLLSDKDLTFLLFNTLQAVDMSVKNPFVALLYPFIGKKYSATAKTMRQIGRYYIKERLRQLTLFQGQQQATDMLTYIFKILKSGDDLGIEDLVDDFVTFYVFGQETTSNMMSFALLELMMNPEIMKRVVEEIDCVLQSENSVTGFDLKQLIYTTQVLEEALRHHPPAPAFPRESGQGLKLSGYSIPNKSRLMLCPYITHHMEEVYNNPWVFDPDRFDAKRPQFDHYQYFPHGIGVRSCIGREFAMIQGKVILVLLLKTFTFTLVEGYKLEQDTVVALYPKNGVPCTLTLRETQQSSKTTDSLDTTFSVC